MREKDHKKEANKHYIKKKKKKAKAGLGDSEGIM